MFADPQQTREITCPSSHCLMQIDDLCQLYEGQSYKQNKYFCETCRCEFHSKQNPSNHCMTCGFDMCPGCYEAQKLVQISCPQNHPLLKVRALQKFSNYSSNKYKCSSCKRILDSSKSDSAHCRACKYDLCPTCLAKSQIVGERGQMQRDGNTLKQVTCPARHILSPVNNLHLMHPTWAGGYASNVYTCDTCRLNFKCQTDASYHCQICAFDICPNCYQKDQKVNFDCSAGHPLYIVSNLKGFNQKTNLSVTNSYVCNSCRGSFDSALNPSCHCRLCTFYLCPNCFDTRRNQIEQMRNNQYENIQQNNNQQQENQMPHNNSQQHQMQQNIQQNFTNLSIQEPIKQVAPHNPEEAKNNQPDNKKKDIPDEMLCVVCLTVQRSHLFTPCMHLCACGPCSANVINKQKGCPMCRVPIQSSIKVFM